MRDVVKAAIAAVLGSLIVPLAAASNFITLESRPSPLAAATLADSSVVGIQDKPAPFVPRPVSARQVSPGVNVLLVSIVVAPANPRRRGFVMFNNSANSTYCCYAATCVAASPVRLIATFTSWEPQQPLIYQGPISCIRNAGNGVVTVWELE